MHVLPVTDSAIPRNPYAISKYELVNANSLVSESEAISRFANRKTVFFPQKTRVNA